MKKNNVLGIIQARMGSKRFPGKVLELLAGKPILWHVTERLKQCEKVDSIIIATSKDKCDMEIVNFAKMNGINVYQGDNENVLKRFEELYFKYLPSIVVRVCCDAPLIDSKFIDKAVGLLQDSNKDYCVTIPQNTCYQGMDIISGSGLKKILDHKEDPVAKEHVTGFIHKEPSLFSLKEIEVNESEIFHGSLAIDTKKDLIRIEEYHKKLNASVGALNVLDLVNLLKREAFANENT